MSERRAQVVTVIAAVVAALVGLQVGRWWHAPPAADLGDVPIAAIGDPAPSVSLPDLEGRARHLDEWKGRPRLVNFWASWCTPCIEEMPMLDAYAAEQAANGTQVIGIALDDPAAVRAFLRQTPVSYPNLIEAAGSTDSSVRFGNRRSVLPFSVMIDAEGRISRYRTGAFEDRDDLAEWATLD